MLDPFIFFFNDTATTEIYTLSLHDALPISNRDWSCSTCAARRPTSSGGTFPARCIPLGTSTAIPTPLRKGCSTRRSEEHTSELQSRQYLVCRLLLEKKKK